jgi:hypothetical protein
VSKRPPPGLADQYSDLVKSIRALADRARSVTREPGGIDTQVDHLLTRAARASELEAAILFVGKARQIAATDVDQIIMAIMR